MMKCLCSVAHTTNEYCPTQEIKMVEYEIITEEGGDFDCKVTVTGTRAELADIGLTDCDLHVDYVEPLVEGFEIGTGVNLRLYQGKHARGHEHKASKLKEVGGDSLGSLGIRFDTMDNDAELYHLKVDDSATGKGLGKLLFTIFVGLCEIEGVESIRMNIGGGEETAGWLQSMGVPSNNIAEKGNNLARVHTNLSEMEYSHLKLEVVHEESSKQQGRE